VTTGHSDNLHIRKALIASCEQSFRVVVPASSRHLKGHHATAEHSYCFNLSKTYMRERMLISFRFRNEHVALVEALTAPASRRSSASSPGSNTRAPVKL